MILLRRLFALAFISFVLSASNLAAQQSGPSLRPITISDLFAMRDVHEPRISPDGKWVAYTWIDQSRRRDKSEDRVWMVPVTGGEAIPLTAEGVSSGHGRWSPDGKFLAFLSERDDPKASESKSQVWLLNRLGGEAQKLTNTPQDVEDFEWAPDGKRLVLILRDAKPEEETDESKSKDKDSADKIRSRKRRSRGWWTGCSSSTTPSAIWIAAELTYTHSMSRRKLLPRLHQAITTMTSLRGHRTGRVLRSPVIARSQTRTAPTISISGMSRPITRTKARRLRKSRRTRRGSPSGVVAGRKVDCILNAT